MLVYIEKRKINIIVCEKVDRLTRNFRDAVAINDWLNANPERQVHFVKENVVLSKDSKSNEKFIWNIKVSVAQYYIDNLSEEVKKGQKEKIAQGWLPTKPPIGYKSVGEKGHKIHVIDEIKGPLVKRMFELYATNNYSINRLTELMYQEGLRNLNGHKIVKSRIHTYLMDPFYIGKVVWNDMEYDGKQDPLINEETYQKVQDIMHGRTTPRSTKRNHPFKSLIHCAKCKGLITWEPPKKGHIYGHCNHYRGCPGGKWTEDKLIEEILLKKFAGLEIESIRLAEWLKKALKESHKDEIAYHSASVTDVNKQYDLIKKRLDNLYTDKLDGKISETEYQRHFNRFSDDLKHADKAIEKHTNASIKYFELGANIFDLSQRATEIYQKADPDQKRMLLRLVFTNYTLDQNPDGWTFKCDYTRPFQILHDAVEVTNGTKLENFEGKAAEIFVPAEKIDNTRQTGDFSPSRSNWLPG